MKTGLNAIWTHFNNWSLILYKGHPAWDPKRPGKNVEAMEKWDQYHEDKRIKKKKQDVEMWEETVGEAAQKKIHMKDQIHTEL